MSVSVVKAVTEITKEILEEEEINLDSLYNEELSMTNAIRFQ